MPRLVEKSFDKKIAHWTKIRDDAQHRLDELIAERARVVGKEPDSGK